MLNSMAQLVEHRSWVHRTGVGIEIFTLNCKLLKMTQMAPAVHQ